MASFKQLKVKKKDQSQEVKAPMPSSVSERQSISQRSSPQHTTNYGAITENGQHFPGGASYESIPYSYIPPTSGPNHVTNVQFC